MASGNIRHAYSDTAFAKVHVYAIVRKSNAHFDIMAADNHDEDVVASASSSTFAAVDTSIHFTNEGDSKDSKLLASLSSAVAIQLCYTEVHVENGHGFWQ